ncbi:MAG TPA: hypothetical protein VKW78_23135 [Terriglobales bacterium]|nr:hypothetical protein [Terriglobales bacterium]
MRRLPLLVSAVVLLFSVAAFCTDDNVPEPTQKPDAIYRLYRTLNIYTFLKLDTRTGLVWQLEWGTEDAYRWVSPINLKPLTATPKAGRFTLYPTSNIYNFVLLDQEDGRAWQIQWGKDKDRVIVPIAGDN